MSTFSSLKSYFISSVLRYCFCQCLFRTCFLNSPSCFVLTHIFNLDALSAELNIIISNPFWVIVKSLTQFAYQTFSPFFYCKASILITSIFSVLVRFTYQTQNRFCNTRWRCFIINVAFPVLPIFLLSIYHEADDKQQKQNRVYSAFPNLIQYTSLSLYSNVHIAAT